MKLEKINNNSIRCIINGSELSTKYNIKLGEIIQGTGNVPRFFKDIICRANKEFGFEPNDYPLIIEAASTFSNEIAFTITKVNSEEEMKRYNKHVLGGLNQIPQLNIDDAVEKMDKLFGSVESESNEDLQNSSNEEQSAVFFFSSFSNLTKASSIVSKCFTGTSWLFHYDNSYALTINIGEMSFEEYYYVFDILSEYSDSYISSDDFAAILIEHEEPLIDSENVLATLSTIH